MFLFTIQQKEGKGIQKLVKTRSSTLTLGRDESCQIRLKNPHFSRVHATLVDQKDGSWIVTDGGQRKTSNTGLLIDGRKVVGSALILEGQTLTLIDQLSDGFVSNLDLASKVDGFADGSTKLLPPENPIKATLKLLPREEVIASADITLSGLGKGQVDAQLNQNLLRLIDSTKEMPMVPAALMDVGDRLLALETAASSAAMIDEAMTARMEAMKGDYEKLTGMLKRKLSAFEGKYRLVMIILLVMLVLKLGEGYAPTELKSWVELAEKALPLIALFQEMRSKR
jgi:pSer/pThr/pTyr-binding forkhead associated (FHA) protein